jgi:hypothetical protein
VVPVVVVPLVVPVVDPPLVVPAVVLDVVLPLVEPDVVPEVLLPDVLPLVVPSVVPDVVPDVVPEVVPEPAFSEAEQALKRLSDAHSSTPVSAENHLLFIGVGKSERMRIAPRPSSIRKLAARFIRIFIRINTYSPAAFGAFCAGGSSGSHSQSTSRTGLATL